ncbi:MAG TPA: hypothetical protein ENJ82_02890 [Bacteroidetes bacterium]|nr:hypothetical protein [Bacteroidota bacterium]
MNRTAKSLFFLALGLSLFIFSCKDDEPENPNQIVSDYYFQAVIDGDTVTYQEGVSDYGQIVGDFWGGRIPGGYQYAPFTCLASAEGVANPGPNTLAESGAVAILVNTTSEANTYAAYSALPTTGVKDIGLLARTTFDSAAIGGYVSWYDAGGVEWTTNGGVQNNPSFVVTDLSDFEDNGWTPASHKLVSINFSCTIYDPNGNSKELTGGRVRGRFIRW